MRTGLGEPECSLELSETEVFFFLSAVGELLELRMLLPEDPFLGNFGGSLLGDFFSGLCDA